MKSLRKRSAITLAAAIVAGICVTNATLRRRSSRSGQARSCRRPRAEGRDPHSAETALLVMDFTVQTCSPQRRPRCAASVPKVQKLVAGARAKGALVIYSVAVPGSTAADILKELTPAAGELVLPPLGPDKFIASDLEKS